MYLSSTSLLLRPLQLRPLREQVQTLAREQRIRDFSSKQIGLDPMPELPIHALEGHLTPVMPTVLPKQLLPATRKIHPADLGVMDNTTIAAFANCNSTPSEETNAKYPYRNEVFRSRNWKS